jgi:hypothetical protein
MILVGTLLVFLGFALSVASLGITSSLGGRAILVLIGIAISLVGIIGVLNRAFLAKAIWRK